MGILKNGLLGPYQGRVGNVIGTFWKGRNVMRIRTVNYNDANTLPQQDQRMRFNLATDFGSLNKTLIKSGFSAQRNSASPYNRALKFNIKNAVTGEYPNLKLDLNMARISEGDLEGLKAPVVSSPQAQTIKLDWTDNSGKRHAEATDNVFISIIDEEIKDAFINDTIIKRSDKTATIELPQKWSGKNAVVMAFTMSEKVISTARNKYQLSTSAVLGRVKVE